MTPRVAPVVEMSRLLIALSVVCVSVVAGCPRSVSTEGCQADLDCGASQRCDVTRGLCLCIDDNACDVTEFCNLAGSCQTRLECFSNTDCEAGAMCDTTTGNCIPQGACVLDSQCPYGSFCAQNRACVPGCNDDGDCPLGEPCINGSCDATPGACTSNAFCEFGQLCNTTNNRCQTHPDANRLCTSCDSSDFFDPCQDECLIDGSIAPTACTSDAQCPRGTCEPARCSSSADCPNGGSCNTFLQECSTSICQGGFCGSFGCDDTNNPCPRGYTCNTLQVVSGVQCTLGNDAQCGANRSCRGGGELGSVGFCSCASNADCPGGLQFPDAECVNPGPNGACIIGTTCGPSDGLLCEDLR